MEEEMLVAIKTENELRKGIEAALYDLEIKKSVELAEYRRNLQAIEDERERLLQELRALKQEG